MKILIVGCGSIGERHIRNLSSISAGKILACDTSHERLELIKEKYKVEIFEKIEDAIDQKPDLVMICTPPSQHISIALKAVEAESHIFIEKPISHTLDGVDELLTKAKKKNLMIFVGYNHRFHEGIIKLKQILDEGSIGKVLSAKAEFGQYLPDWRPWQDYTKSYTARKDLGGGIILDGSHEIDYLFWLLGKINKVSCFADKISDLKVDVEDTADIMLKFDNNAIGKIHLDFIQHSFTRNCKIIGELGTAIFDYVEKNVKLYSTKTKKWKTFPIKTTTDDSYIAEIKHVLNCINGKEKPLSDGESAKTVLQIALAAKKSAKTDKVIKL